MSDNKFVMSNAAYSGAERLVKIILPGIATMVSGVMALWDIPGDVKVVGTITLITTFLGVLLGVSAKNYDKLYKYDGKMLVEYDEGGLTGATMEYEKPLDWLAQQEEVRFKITPYDHEVEEPYVRDEGDI